MLDTHEMKSPPEDEKSEMECVASDKKGKRNNRPRRESTKSKTGGCGAHISSRDQQTRKPSIRPPCQGVTHNQQTRNSRLEMTKGEKREKISGR